MASHEPAGAGEVTELLRRLPAEGEVVERRLLELLGDQLHAVAVGMMARERPGHTLQPTLLVDEAWMRMGAQHSVPWRNREQFLALAAQAMRRLLLNHARDRAAVKRDHGLEPAAVESILAYYEERHLDLLAVDEALQRLAEQDDVAAQVVELRFFGGLSLPEVADVLGTSLRSVERGWTRARLALREELG